MTVGISNSDVADVLERHGRLLEISGESPFRTRAFTRAAESLRLYPERVVELAAEGRLREIPGIGEGISAAIRQIVETGSFDAHSKLTDRIPESLVELTTIPGVGAKTALRLHSELGVDSLAALEAALVSGRVRAAKGLGARAEAAMLAGIEAVQRRSGRTPLGIALPAARAFMAAFSALRPDDAPESGWQRPPLGHNRWRPGFRCRLERFQGHGHGYLEPGNGHRRPVAQRAVDARYAREWTGCRYLPVAACRLGYDATSRYWEHPASRALGSHPGSSRDRGGGLRESWTSVHSPGASNRP